MLSVKAAPNSGVVNDRLAAVGKDHAGRYTFTKAERILRRSDYLHVSRFGKKVQNAYFLALFCPNQSERMRLGITVTAKIGNAVTRNRIKRWVREFFRLNVKTLCAKWDINIIVKKRAATLNHYQATASLQSLFKDIAKKIDF